jgi:hypothetical protein
MTNPLAQDLGGVVRLLEKATPGPWTVGQFGSVHRPKVEGSESSVGSAIVVGGSKSGMYDGYQENCEAIAAAVNFLRTHSAEIAGALRDAERYRWLKCNCQHMPDELGIAGQLYFGTYAWGDLDTAIDSAMQQGS